MDSGVTQREKSAWGMALRFAGVSMVLGSTAFTVIPKSLVSAATFFTSATTADFATAYAANFGNGSTAARDPIATILPRFAAVIGFSTARMLRNATRRLIVIIRSQVASSVSQNGAPPPNPPTR